METLQRTANRGSISTGYDVENSLKFEADNTEYLSRTPSSAGNRKTWTFSGWVKRTEIGSGGNTILSAGDTYIQFDGNALQINFRAASENFFIITNRLFRDTSAWYHIVVQCDTTQGTASNRAKVWVNGVQETSFSTSTYGNMSQNYDTLMNSTNEHEVGKYSNEETTYANFFNGYMAEMHLVDGTALTPTSFGEFDDDSGIWKPKAYTGSYGTNGFYLDFENASSLGADSSGNGNNFTPTNITSADQATDTPTNNFCTLNFNTGYIQGSDATTFTQGATTRQGGSSSYNGALGTIGINPFVGSAKWYWEVELSANNNGNGIELGAGWLATSIIQSTTADKATAGNNAGFQIWTSFDYDPPGEGTGADGDVFGFLLQCDSSNPNLKIYKNDTLFTTRHTATSYDFENDFYFPVVFIYNTGMKAFFNFGNPFDATVSSGNTDPNGYGNFEFDTKSGYALCTKNLAEYG